MMAKKKHRSARRKPAHWLRRHFISGLVVIVPLGITVMVIRFALEWMSGLLLPALRLVFDRVPSALLLPLSILGFVFGLWLIGFMASRVIGRRVIGWGEYWIARLPLVKSVYTTSKQVVDLVIMDDASAMREVVMIEYPHPGLRALGFVSGRIIGVDGAEYYKVFVPTTPNPTSGFLQIVPLDKAVRLDISIEDAVKFIMSGGILGPPALTERSGGELDTDSDSDDEDD
jgi:uncharacterized membrane protein